MNVCQGLVQALVAEGTEVVFGLMAEDNIDLLLEMENQPGLKVFMTRHEQGAVAMADGYARITGRPGVCVVGRGPAVAHTGTALVTARKRPSPVIMLVPFFSINELHSNKYFEQEMYLRSTVGNVVTIRNPKTLEQDIHRAFRHAQVTGEPVAVQIPLDFMNADLGPGWTYGPVEPVMPQRIQPDANKVEEAAALLAAAERPPVIVAGRGAVNADARAEIEELAERVGAVLTTTVHAKGLFGSHDWYLGISGTFATDFALEFLSSADCVLAIGCSLNKHTTYTGRLFSRARIIHVDTDPTALSRITPATVNIIGDAKATVAAINRCLADMGVSNRFWTDELKQYIASYRSRIEEYVDAGDGLDPRLVVDECNRLLPQDRIAVVDGGQAGFFVAERLTVPHPSDFIWRVDFSAIGLGLPLGVGAAVAAPDRNTIVFAGDAGFMMIVQELETAVRYRIPLTVLLMNDRALGAEYHVMKRDNKPPELATHSTPDFARLAEALGARGISVRNIDELRQALQEVGNGKSDVPTVIEVPITRQVSHQVFNS